MRSRSKENVHHVNIFGFDGRQKSENTHRLTCDSPCSNQNFITHDEIAAVENRPERKAYEADSVNGPVKI